MEDHIQFFAKWEFYAIHSAECKQKCIKSTSSNLTSKKIPQPNKYLFNYKKKLIEKFHFIFSYEGTKQSGLSQNDN